MLKLSPTKIDDYMNCPRAFYYKYIEGHPDKTSRALVVGSLYHSVIAEVLRTSIAELEPAVNTAMEESRAALLDTEHTEAEGLQSRNLDRLWVEVYRNVERLHREVLCYLRPVRIEEFYENKRFGFRGIIDCLSAVTPVPDAAGHVCGTVADQCVVDFKVKTTTARRRTARDAAVSPQLAAYALETGATAAAFVEIPRNESVDIRVRLAQYSEEEIERWRTWFDNTMEGIRALGEDKQKFLMTPRKNALCSALWCPFYGKCYGARP